MNNFLNQPISWQNEYVRQSVAVGLLLLVAGLMIWSFSSHVFDSRAQVHQLEKMLAGYERAIEMEPVLQKRLIKLQSPGRGDAVLLGGENEALAGAELQENFKSVVQRAQGVVERSQTLGSQSEGNFQKIIVRSQLVLSIGSLQKVLYALESGRPYVFIENLDVKDASNQKNVTGDILKVTIDFYGYRRLAVKP